MSRLVFHFVLIYIECKKNENLILNELFCRRLGNALENAIFKDEIHPLKPAEIPRNCASSNSTKRPKAIVIDSDDNMNPFDVNQGPWAQASLKSQSRLCHRN